MRRTVRCEIPKYLVLAVLVLASGIALCWANAEADSLSPKDSVLVHLVDAGEGMSLDGNLQVTLRWKVFAKRYDPQTGKYGDWSLADDFRGKFEVLVALDSAFSKVVKRIETDSTVCTITGLFFGAHYWWKVNLISPDLPSRSDFAEGVIYKHHPYGMEHKAGLIPWIKDHWVALAFFGALITLPLLAVAIVIIFLIVKLNKRSEEKEETT